MPGPVMSCVILHQTESSVPPAEPSDGRWNRCGADLCTPEPSLGAPAPGPDEAQTDAGATAAEAPPGMVLEVRAVCSGSQ